MRCRGRHHAFWANKKNEKRNHFFVENMLRNLCYRVKLRAVYRSRGLVSHDEVVVSSKLDLISVWRFVAGNSLSSDSE